MTSNTRNTVTPEVITKPVAYIEQAINARQQPNVSLQPISKLDGCEINSIAQGQDRQLNSEGHKIRFNELLSFLLRI